MENTIPDEINESGIAIRTERLTIRTASDGEMHKLIAEEPDEGLKAAYGEMLALSEANPDRRQWYAAWLIELPTGERVGDLCFKGLSAEGVTEIGYGLLPEFRGRGYASEAVKDAVRWAAEQDGVRTIIAETDPGNLASQRVLAKAGFVPTGKSGEEGPRFVYCGLPER